MLRNFTVLILKLIQIRYVATFIFKSYLLLQHANFFDGLTERKRMKSTQLNYFNWKKAFSVKTLLKKKRMWQRILNRLNMSFFMFDIFFLQCKQGYCHRPYVWTLKSRNCGELSNLSLSYTHVYSVSILHSLTISFFHTRLNTNMESFSYTHSPSFTHTHNPSSHTHTYFISF
jgi:hypothetical protein